MAGGQEQGVFISYRRADTRADAGRLYDRLSSRFGGARVFMDIDDIAPGQDFQLILRDTLDNCRVLLVLIGPAWLGPARVGSDDREGVARLQQQGDLVRLEVATALQRGIPVVPVLFDRAAMPAADELPDDLRDLASRQALEISDLRFHDDADDLIKALEPLLGGSAAASISRRSLLGVFTGAVLVAALGAWWLVAPAPLPDVAAPPELKQSPTGFSRLRAQAARVGEADLLVMLQQRDFFDSAHWPAGRGGGQSLELALVGDDAVVTDARTGLMWQQNRTGGQRSFDRVQAHLLEINAKGFAGHADWRLPTLEEVMSLLAPAENAGGYVSPLFSPGKTSILWTADWASEQSRWVVYTYPGTAKLESPEFNAWVRAVRRTD